MPIPKVPVALVVKRIGTPLVRRTSFYSLTCSSHDEEDETAELLRELEKIKKERAEKQAEEVGVLTFRYQC